MNYSTEFKLFYRSFYENCGIEESTLWLRFFGMARNLLNGEFSEFLVKAPKKEIAYIVKMYLEELYSEKYFNDIKGLHPHPYSKKCPDTGFLIDPVNISIKTIDAIELVWEKYYPDPEQYLVLSRILDWTWQIENSGYAGFVDFDRKWEMAKKHPESAWVINYFLNQHPSDSFDIIYNFLPTEKKKQLCLDALNHFNLVVDVERHRKKKVRIFHYRLAKNVIDDKNLDDEFKEIFKPFLW
jgi:hypothetical protein